MNFQEAIEIVLASSPRPLTPVEIANAINERKLYLDWKGKPVNANLVIGRASQHSNTFEITGNLIGLLNNNTEINNILRQLRNILAHTYLPESDILIPFLAFWARLSNIGGELKQRYFGHYDFYMFASNYFYKEVVNYLKDTFIFFSKRLELESNISLDSFQNTLKQLENDRNDFVESYKYIVDVIRYSVIFNEDFSDKEFSYFFNEILKGQRLQYRFQSYNNTNNSILHLVKKIIGNNNSDSFYDPFAGTAGFVNSIVDNFYTKIRLYEINNTTALLGWMSLTLSGYKNFEYIVKNSLYNFDSDTYDLIITEPPFNVKLPDYFYHESYNFLRAKDFDSIYLQLIISKLNAWGKAIVIVPDGVLFSKKTLKIREYLVSEDILQMVISLPLGILQPLSGIKLNILVINKVKKLDRINSILFQELNNEDFILEDIISINSDWSQLPLNAISISNADILKNADISLNVSQYVKLFDSDNVKISIKSLINTSKSGKPGIDTLAIKRQYVIESNPIPLITIKDLSDSISNYNLNLDSVDKYIVDSEGKFIKELIYDEAILIAKIGNKLKVTYFDGKRPIIISSNVMALFANNEVLAEFLISQLNQEYVIKQLKRIRKGLAQPYFTKKDFLDVKIKFLPLAEQKEYLNEYYKEAVVNTERIISDEKRKSDEVEITILSSLQHELRGQILQPLKQEVGNIKAYLNKKNVSTQTFSWEDKLTNLPYSRKVKEAFEHIDEVIITATKLFDNIQSLIDLDKSKIKKEKVLLQELIKTNTESFKDELKDIHISYSFNFDGKSKIECEIDKNSFSNIISNFIRNSLVHGFDETVNNKIIAFNIYKTEDGKDIILEMVDNGKGFSDNFSFSDYKSFGIKSNSQGSGIGGYLLSRTVEIHEGILENINKGKIISIPAYRNYPFLSKDAKAESKEITFKSGVYLRIILPTINKEKL
ncbi:N-6 DNA methylase [Emticicia sp. TH156]|uniref:N-6 DNA methylase n=1 Tax=Emticicia sp. TH156 TaxID=2067454 RepID=UPI000C78D8BD|nr:N-6 DNA methylase [Emticicia sp. TH156]PLK42119.1 hypothetical protein C0V77_22545 [Emticicia sp. TH156]